MAEAHSAVAFSFAITHEGWDVNFDREVLHLVWDSGVRSWKKRVARLKNNLKTGFYPVPISSLFATAAVVSGSHYYGIELPGLDKILRLIPNKDIKYEIAACAGLSAIGFLGFSLSLKYALKALFMYKGWMYESRGPGKKPSLKTRAWLFCVKLVSGPSRPMLYSYQGSLPRLPLPSVKETMARYLRSVRPLLDDKQYTRMEKLAQEFQNGIGVKLQRYLVLKSWWATNYVSDWWEEYVYLRGRSPLMINSNFYGIDTLFMHPTTNQAARAAVVIYSMLQFRRLIERQELEPIMLQGVIPLCSWQYERMFNTTRVPGVETDKIVHLLDSKHIVVYNRGRFFKVIIHHNRRILLPCELEIQMQNILDNDTPPSVGEERLAALTAGDRAHWAQTRQEHFFKGINRQALDAIEKAAFIVCLDDVPYEFDKNVPSKLDEFGRTLLHGKGYDRWFDKSFTLCVGTNGKIGVNAEHSWADAAVTSHLWEFTIIEETSGNWYKEDGHTKGTPSFAPPPPIKLQWDLKDSCLNAIDASYQVARQLIDDIDLHIYMHDAYGKGFMKQCRLSPDAYLQMALQLAYYRNAGKFSLTYEASMTRLYREGRTETVRPCSIESATWVKAMSDNSKTVSEKVALLQKACLQHQKAYLDAMCGKGIDRHLFCLYVVSKYLEVDSPFLKEVLSEPWRLSTSQTPHGQTSKLDLKKYPNCISAGGGFGPVADDGYGVSYIVAGEDILFFHISCKKSCPTTDSKKFGQDIKQALHDIRTLFLEYKKENGAKK
ncbi:carnitine O-palmitoyltransferase 1, muscle isoform isoform X2 [Halyomorpha halys]|uniref:carnitine O-palmitoyltransferase 1, muscle isoform isoform X2 n=1 Tax=Halyomorpha halys TaxID=286706 RepID=UPI0006D50FD5|nr:carnitine O-palmitoyltransferase 1, muscle isoform isoform X2 [Halyomorpha halys]